MRLLYHRFSFLSLLSSPPPPSLYSTLNKPLYSSYIKPTIRSLSIRTITSKLKPIKTMSSLSTERVAASPNAAATNTADDDQGTSIITTTIHTHAHTSTQIHTCLCLIYYACNN